MTCIVGAVAGPRLVLGCDSYLSWGGEAMTVPSKIMRLDVPCASHGEPNLSLLVGSSGTWRFSNVLEYQLDLPQFDVSESARHYLATKFVPELREICDRLALLVSKDGSTKRLEDTALIGWRGQLFYVAEDFSLVSGERYGALGLGANFAIGAMYAYAQLHQTTWSPDAAASIGLDAAGRHSEGVRAPFVFEALDSRMPAPK